MNKVGVLCVHVLQLYLQLYDIVIKLHPQSTNILYIQKQKEKKQTNMNQKQNIALRCGFTAGCGSSPPWQWDALSCWQETWESWVCVTSRWAGRWGLWASGSWWCLPAGRPLRRWSCLQLGWRGTPQIPEGILEQADNMLVFHNVLQEDHILIICFFTIEQHPLTTYHIGWLKIENKWNYCLRQ